MSTLDEYRKRFASRTGGGWENRGLPEGVTSKYQKPGFGMQSQTGKDGPPTKPPYLGPPDTLQDGGGARNMIGSYSDYYASRNPEVNQYPWANGGRQDGGGSQGPSGYGPGYQTYQGQYPQQQSQAGPTSIYDVFNSAIPLMNANRDQQIGQAMAQAGLQGTRFGTAAQNNAARIGADTALQQDQLLTNLMYQQGQSDADRSLQATSQSMQLAQIYDQMQRSRIDQLSQVGMWEQGRGDMLNQIPYQDWMASRMGYLPYVMQGITGQGAMPQGQPPITTTTPAGTGLADYAMLAAAMYGMFSDKRLKKDIVRHSREAIPGVPFATWKWKWNDKPAFGVIADDLEKVRPDLVFELDGIKCVRYKELMEAA